MIEPARPRDAELAEVLEEALQRPVLALSRRGAREASTWPLEEVDVRLADCAAPLRLMFKDLSGAPFPGVEPAMWSQILPRAGMSSLVCFAAVSNPEAGRHWVFLERIAARPLREFGEPAAWTRTAEWLGDFHRRVQPQAADAAKLGILPCMTSEQHVAWLERARELRPGTAQAVAGRFDEVLEALSRAEMTVIHGEFYPSNVLVEDAPGGFRIYPLDWERASTAPAVLDVAAMITGAAEDLRQRMLEAYESARGTRPGDAELAAARVRLALQWLGWRAGWHAPEQHRFDWENEALSALEGLRS